MSLPFDLPPPASTEVDLDRVAQVIARAFDPLPVSQYLQLSLSTGVSQEHIDGTYRKAIDRYLQQGAMVFQSHDHTAVAIWFPPGCKKKANTSGPEGTVAPKLVRLGKAFEEATAKLDYYKSDYWHLQYLAKDPTREHVPGAISSLVRPFLSHAKETGVPCVLETALDEKAAKVYAHWGFENQAKVALDGVDILELMVYNK